jgi:hypothetical protein
MTREECISNLKFSKCTPHKKATVTMAIKSLEAWDKVIEEIEESKESVVGRYDVNTPEWERPYAKTMRNNGRKEALQIIKKHLGEVEE